MGVSNIFFQSKTQLDVHGFAVSKYCIGQKKKGKFLSTLKKKRTQLIYDGGTYITFTLKGNFFILQIDMNSNCAPQYYFKCFTIIASNQYPHGLVLSKRVI